jgi:DNA-binding CsgD family transcriptional regulator
MRLLERDGPLATLQRLRAEAGSDGGRLVFLEGEAGVGKTALLGAFRRTLPGGVLCLLGSCDPLSTPRPLGPLVEIADELDPTFARLVRDGAPRTDVLGGLLDALRRHGANLVLLLDDLHWADEATLDALRFVGRRIETTSVLIVGTYRDDEVGPKHPLRVVVGDLATSPAVRRLPLAGLSVRSVGELVGGTGIDPVELHELTGGNPFYVTEVIAGALARIPATVRDAVLARAARLSPPARRALEAAAVIGPVVDPALLSTIVGDGGAEECLALGLLIAQGRAYAFRHEVARRAILDAVDPIARTRLHARVLEALERDHRGAAAPAALLAHHAAEALDGGAVLRLAPEAARQAAAASAHREAAAHYAGALVYAGLLPAIERAILLEAAGREHTLVARYDVGRRAYEEAIAIWQGVGDARRAAAALAELSKVLVTAGRNAEAELASRQALETAGRLADGPEKVEAINAQAYLRMLDRDNDEAVRMGRSAIDLGVGEPRAVASVVQAWNTVGSSRILLGDDGGRADLETSLRLALEHGLERNAASAYAVLASALGEMYRFADAEPYFEAGIRYASERDLDSSRLYLEAWRALTLVHRGRWSEAGTLAAQVLAREDNSAISRIMALLAVGRLRARRGDPDVWLALDEALTLSEPTATLQRLGPVRAARAEAAWLDGDLTRAAAEAASVFELAREKRHPWHIGELGWWQRVAGLPAPDVGGAAEPWRLQHEGRWREAAAAWRVLDCPYESARALLDADDVTAVTEAHAEFDRLGARPARALAARRLRDLGVTVVPRGRRPTTAANAAGLTTRELEVLRLVTEGLPNSDIAARLFLSPRTVDHHVSAVLGKLGVGRRSDAAAAAARAGIAPQNGQSVEPD